MYSFKLCGSRHHDNCLFTNYSRSSIAAMLQLQSAKSVLNAIHRKGCTAQKHQLLDGEKHHLHKDCVVPFEEVRGMAACWEAEESVASEVVKPDQELDIHFPMMVLLNGDHSSPVVDNTLKLTKQGYQLQCVACRQEELMAQSNQSACGFTFHSHCGHCDGSLSQQ